MVPIRCYVLGQSVVVQAKGFQGKLKEMQMDCTPEMFMQGIARYKAGDPMQNAFPFLNNEEREFLISGTTPEEWKAMFPEEG